jgi:hypothetical protein
MPVDEGTHTVSLSELESIFITLRFMEADKVYESKQVLVMIDMKINIVCIIEPSTNLVCFAKVRKNGRSEKTTKEENRPVKILCTIILSPPALACHSTQFDQKRICPPWNAFTTKLEL